MRKKLLVLSLALTMAMITGCGDKKDEDKTTEKTTSSSEVNDNTGDTDNTEDTDSVDSEDNTAVSNENESPEGWFEYLDSTTVMGLTDEGKQQKELVVPGGVTLIKSEAFKDSQAEEVSFANPDVVIEGYLFGHSNGSEFNECLKSIVLPANMTEMPKGICFKCHALETVVIPENVTNVSDYAFACDISLTEVNLPSTVKTIGNNAFHACSALTKVTGAENLEVFADSCMDMCEELTEVPHSEKLTTVGYDAFDYCHKLTEVYLPASVTSLGKSCLANSGITELDISSTTITVIPENMCYRCKDLKTIKFPATLEKIEISAFYAVTGDVYGLPESVEITPTCGLHENQIK